MKSGIAVLLLMAISWVATAWADDVPPSAATPQSQSDQSEVTTIAPRMDAQVTMQPTGSAAGARRVVPMARKVDPAVSKQPVGSEPSR